jgi:hypothetical protein
MNMNTAASIGTCYSCTKRGTKTCIHPMRSIETPKLGCTCWQESLIVRPEPKQEPKGE